MMTERHLLEQTSVTFILKSSTPETFQLKMTSNNDINVPNERNINQVCFFVVLT